MARTQRLRELQRRGLDDLARFGQPQFSDTWFPYTSGEVGPFYIQSIVVEQDGAAYRRSVEALCELIEATVGGDAFDAVSGGESRDWDFSNPVAAFLAKPHIKIYKDGRLLGASPSGCRIVHVADLNNQGSSMRDVWAPVLRAAGGRIVHAFFFVDRLEDGVGVLEDLGIPSAAVVPLDGEAWRYLRDIEYISDGMYASLERRRADKRAWAIEALRRHIDPLGRMLESPRESEVARAMRILEVGYPEHRAELIELLGRSGYRVPDLRDRR
ncbi:MAG: orotate phosphoribosyltransferase [Spirochaetaceae bacterium]